MNRRPTPRTKKSHSQATVFDAAIDEGIASKHVRITNQFWKSIRTRGSKLAHGKPSRPPALISPVFKAAFCDLKPLSRLVPFHLHVRQSHQFLLPAIPAGCNFTSMKQPVINLEETIGKTVGKNFSGAADYDRLVDAAEQIMPTLPFPKGVYRFRSFEEADAWTQHYILKAAREKNRARPDAAT
jgi:hypothetical protein